MIEAVMYFALGFLAASLVALLILPAVWHRAVRLTTKRIEGAIPVSMAEIQADKDQLRAGFAMTARRLELVLDRVKERNAAQLAEIAETAEQVRRLTASSEDRASQIAALEAERDEIARRHGEAENELAVRTAALADLEERLARSEAELAAEAGRLDERSSLAASLQVETVALTTRRDMLADRVADLERERDAYRVRLEELQEQFAALRVAASETATALATEQSRTGDLGTRLADVESHLTDSREEAASLVRTITALQAEIDGRHASYGARPNGAGGDRAGMADADALLRERITDVAAEVARLTAALEGASSPIPTLVAAECDEPESRQRPAGAPASLAERIRALQGRAAAG